MSGSSRGAGGANREVVIGVGDPVSGGASFTRPANTTAYASGDLVANNATAGSVVPMSWTLGKLGGYAATLTGFRILTDSTSITNATFRLHLYKASPTPANGDNGAFSTDSAADYLGYFECSDMLAFTDGAVGLMYPQVGNFRALALGGTNTTVYGLLEARGAYTPTSAEVFTLTPEGYYD